MAVQSPIRSALNKRLGVQDPDDPTALDATPPAPAPAAPGAPAAPPDARPGAQMNVSTGPITTQPVAPPVTTAGPAPAAPAPELAGWQSVQGGNLDRAWTDFATMKYGGTGRAGFANMPGGGLQQAVQEFNQATGANARMVPGPSGDLIDFGDGRGPVDVKTSGGQLWNQRLGGDNGGAGSAPGSGVGGATGAGGGFGAAGGASGGVSDYTQKVRDLIMQQLTTLGKPVTADDPSIAPEMQAQSRLLERNRQDRRAAAAERAASDGLLNGGQGSGSFEGEVASGYEDKGQQLSGIQAQLFGREIQSRRDKVAQLLQMAQQSGDAESARALQLQMAQMDDQIKRLNLQQQQSQWNDEFGLRGGEFQYWKDRDLANSALGK